jgi:3D (Asp-Asp-Asp) domain-containing protein
MAVAGVPQFGAIIDFTDGATFISTAFTLDNSVKGQLGSAQLANADDSVDVGSIAIQASIRRGRNRILDKFEAGSATVILQDDNGNFNPSNTNSPYYGKILPLRKITIYADYNGTRYTLFNGFIMQFVTQFAVGVNDRSSVTLICTDGFRMLTNVQIGTVTGTTAGDTTGTRVTKFLDIAQWPTSQRSLDTGTSTVQVDPGTSGRNLLDAIQLVADKSEFGTFFVDRKGNAVFFSRQTLGQKAANPATIYSDDGTNIGYQGIELKHDDVLIVNDVSVNRLGGSVQQVTDSASITTYYQHSGVRADILVQTDAEALNQAKMLLASRKDAVLHISSFNLNLFDQSAPTRIAAGLNSEIFDVIQVTKTMPGSTSITKTLFVQGVQHDMTKRSFDTKLLTAEPIIQSFILNSSIAGVLDSSSSLLSY